MKKLFNLIFFTCFFFNSLSAWASDVGNVSLDFSTAEPPREITFQEQLDSVLEIGAFFDKNYPDNKINGDLTEDLAKFFPEIGTQELYDKSELVRDGVKFYRYFHEVYDNVKAKMLVPDAPPLIVAEEEYDKGYDAPYVESNDLVVIEDFKKVLSYGPNKQDYEAFKAKYIKDHEKDLPADQFEQLSKLLKKLDWKKIPFYGFIYEDPFSGKKGIGEWFATDENKEVKVRLISAVSTIGDGKNLRGAVHVSSKVGFVVLAQPKPEIDFSLSQNLENTEIFRPYPERIIDNNNQKDFIAYRKDFAIPVMFSVKDASKEAQLSAKVKFTLCNVENRKCKEMEATPALNLEAGMDFRSAVSNYVIQSFNLLPQNKSKSLKIKALVVDKGSVDEGEVLRLVYERSRDVTQLDVFIDDSEHIAFNRPKIAINNDEIIVRFVPYNKDVKLVGKEFDITARYNVYDSLREKAVAEEASWFDFMQNKLSLGVVLLAILGGLILNFMPCVFPVLSIKIISLTKFGHRSSAKMHKNFLLTILGIFITFLFIASALSGLKYLGYSIGWGMQFQNPIFLVCIIFVIMIFVAQIWGLIEITAPDWLNRLVLKNADKDNFLHFLTGVLVVVMATPCTAPYLGTAIGFALSGSILDIYVIMMAVALGLSIPYLVMLFVTDISVYLPKPGPWMNKLNNFMVFMLILTLVWLLSILYAQSDGIAIIHLCICLTIFIMVIWFRKTILKRLELFEEEENIKRLLHKLINGLAYFIYLILFMFAMFDINGHFTKHQDINQITKAKVIDYAQIANDVQQGKIVLVAVGADWCLTCKYNDLTVLDNFHVSRLKERDDFVFIEIDWTNYNADVLEFMERFGRKGLPFYVVFSRMIPDGMVLPEVLNERGFLKIINEIQSQ